ncbi:MAG: tetratricopeptide repeat protein [Myxococcota bacterium]
MKSIHLSPKDGALPIGVLAIVHIASYWQIGSAHAQPTESELRPAAHAVEAAVPSSSQQPIQSLERLQYLRQRPAGTRRPPSEIERRQLQTLLAFRESLLTVRRSEAIQRLERFIERVPERAPEMADALLRLAELRSEVARLDYLRAFKEWQQEPEATRGAEPQPDYARSIRLYDRILEGYPEFPRYDLVLYVKAYALLEQGDMDLADALYRRLLLEFDESRFVPDAHFARAEIYFSRNRDYPRALSEYEEVIRYPESPLHETALFKSAWCLWRLGDRHASATRFREVLDLSQSRESGGQTRSVVDRRVGLSRQRAVLPQYRANFSDLQNEALGYLVEVFTEDEDNAAEDIFAFLDEIGGEAYALMVVDRLAETFLGQARFERAIESYALLVALDPSSASAPNYRRQVASAYASLNRSDAVVAELQKLAETYGADSPWARQQVDPRVVQSSLVQSERAIRHQALQYHERGQQESDAEAFEHAAELYRLYLAHFQRTSRRTQFGSTSPRSSFID